MRLPQRRVMGWWLESRARKWPMPAARCTFQSIFPCHGVLVFIVKSLTLAGDRSYTPPTRFAAGGTYMWECQSRFHTCMEGTYLPDVALKILWQYHRGPSRNFILCIVCRRWRQCKTLVSLNLSPSYANLDKMTLFGYISGVYLCFVFVGGENCRGTPQFQITRKQDFFVQIHTTTGFDPCETGWR